jgi:hypothetical protein
MPLLPLPLLYSLSLSLSKAKSACVVRCLVSRKGAWQRVLAASVSSRQPTGNQQLQLLLSTSLYFQLAAQQLSFPPLLARTPAIPSPAVSSRRVAGSAQSPHSAEKLLLLAEPRRAELWLASRRRCTMYCKAIHSLSLSLVLAVIERAWSAVATVGRSSSVGRSVAGGRSPPPLSLSLSTGEEDAGCGGGGWGGWYESRPPPAPGPRGAGGGPRSRPSAGPRSCQERPPIIGQQPFNANFSYASSDTLIGLENLRTCYKTRSQRIHAFIHIHLLRP